MLLILIAVLTAPVLEMAVMAPVATVLVWLLIILLLILRVATAAELDMAVNAPVPVFVPEMMLFVDIPSVPAPPELIIPLYTEAAVPNDEQF